MKRRLLVVGLLVVCVAMLSGCDFLDQLIDQITGGAGGPGGGTPPPGGGTTTSGAITSVKIEYTLAAIISEKLMPTYPVTTKVGSIVTVIGPRTGNYVSASRTFTAASWDNAVGNFSNTYMQVKLNAAEDAVESFHVRQTQSNVFWAWTFVNEIRGDSIAHSHDDGDTSYFVMTGTNVHERIDLLTYKGWARESEGYDVDNPIEWLESLSGINPNLNNDIATPSINNTITITVYR